MYRRQQVRSKCSGDQSAVEIKVQWRSKCSGDQSAVEIKGLKADHRPNHDTDRRTRQNECSIYHAVPSGLQKSYQELEIDPITKARTVSWHLFDDHKRGCPACL